MQCLGFLYLTLRHTQLTASQAHHTSTRMSQTMGRSSFPEMIIKKRDGGQLSAEEIHDFIEGVTSNTMQQSQIGETLYKHPVRELSLSRETREQHIEPHCL